MHTPTVGCFPCLVSLIFLLWRLGVRLIYLPGQLPLPCPFFFPYAFNILSTCDFCLRIYSNRGHLLDLGCVRFCMVRFGVDA